ncbi:MAG: FAD:protein FMN transferase [Gammaproteobacteria bacterium]
MAALCVYAAYTYNSSSTYLINGQIYGTYWSVTSTKYIDLTTQKRIKERLKEIDLIASNYNENSELAIINKLPIAETVVISNELNYLLEASESVHYLTNGLFNIVMGIESSLMGFGPKLNTEIIHKNIRWLKEAYLLNSFELTKHQEFHFDLSAIAKGFAVDEISKILINEGYNNFVLDIGGELAIFGRKLESSWTIAIQDPSYQSSQPIYSFSANTPMYLATSGEYRNYKYDMYGNRLTHTIDPRTYSSIQNKGLSVTVRNKASAMLADAYATALNVMDVEEGLKFANSNNIQVMYITSDKIYFSESWDD